MRCERYGWYCRERFFGAPVFRSPWLPLHLVVTILEGSGAYTGANRPVLYCVITRAEVATLKAIINEIDPRAFMVIGSAYEVLGEGFKPLKAK